MGLIRAYWVALAPLALALMAYMTKRLMKGSLRCRATCPSAWRARGRAARTAPRPPGRARRSYGLSRKPEVRFEGVLFAGDVYVFIYIDIILHIIYRLVSAGQKISHGVFFHKIYTYIYIYM